MVLLYRGQMDWVISYASRHCFRFIASWTPGHCTIMHSRTECQHSLFHRPEVVCGTVVPQFTLLRE